MAVDWALGLPQHDLSADANAAFQRGQQGYEQNMAKGALGVLLKDPTNQRALAALAQVDPERAMEFRKTQLEYGGKSHDEWVKTVAHAAKQATTPEAWDATIDQFVAAGHPEAAQLKGKFSPAVRSYYMAQGGLDDGHDPQDPGIIREFDEATKRGLVPPGTTYTQYVALRNPGMNSPVTIPQGAVVTANGGQAAPQTATGPNGQKIQLNPQTGQWEPVGGAGGNASGGFPQ